VLKGKISLHDIFVRKEIVSFSQKFNNPNLIADTLKESEAELNYARAVECFNKGKFDDAVEAFSAAVAKNNLLVNPAVQRLLRLKLQRINIQQEKIKSLQEELYSVRDIQKEYAHEYYLMGNECVTKAKDLRAAIRNFEKALKLNPSYTDAWVRKGVTLLDMDDDYEALLCLHKAVKLSPQSFKARYNRGKCHLLLKHYEEAAGDLLKAVSIKPKHAAAHEYLAETFRYMGKVELAQKHRNIADELNKCKRQ
jgi:tetratricopeptide (TPR) repeat protein